MTTSPQASPWSPLEPPGDRHDHGGVIARSVDIQASLMTGPPAAGRHDVALVVTSPRAMDIGMTPCRPAGDQESPAGRAGRLYNMPILLLGKTQRKLAAAYTEQATGVLLGKVGMIG